MILNVMNAVKSQLVSISVVNTQTVYNYGADINKSAITVTATYKSGAMKEVTYFSISPQTATNSTITVAYSENGVTARASFNITILRLLESIVAVPNAAEYEYAAAVGATTTAFYSDGSQATVTGTLSPTSAVAQNVNVSYTESGVTKTYSMPINVYPSASQFTDGAATVESDGTGEWTMYCNTSGTLNLRIPYDIDVWCVGGGGGGANSGQLVNQSNSAGGGGGGGYTALGSNISVAANTTYEVVVGAGGSKGTAPGSWVNVREAGSGGVSSAFNISANGGQGGAATNASNSSLRPRGGNGGSGGGGTGPGQEHTYGGNGGSNGSNGTGTKPGIGSGEFLRDFRSFSGVLRAGGGGGGNYKYYNWNGSNDIYLGQGGAGGGGDGNYGQWTSDGSLRSGYNGQANYGGGGGGGGYNQGTGASQHCDGGYGGSGIVVIRKHKDESVNKFGYSYNGISTYLQEDADNWMLTLTGSGTLTVTENTAVDIYLLGGGQGGYAGDSTSYGGYSGTFYIGGAGGQGGYVNIVSNVTLASGTYTATVGNGGATGNGASGGTTSLGTYQAPGGGSGASASGTITAGAAGGNAGALRGSDTPYGGGAGANSAVYDFNGVNRGGGGGGGYSYRYNNKSDDYSYGYAENSGGLQGGARSYTYGVSGQPRGNISALANYGGGGSGGIESGSPGSTGIILIRNHRS